jgi:hypothetical protein
VLRIARDRLDRLRGVIGERPFDTIERLGDADPDGWIRLKVQLDWPNEVTTQILAVGPGCELLEPEPLRRRIAEESRRLAARYQDVERRLPMGERRSRPFGRPGRRLGRPGTASPTACAGGTSARRTAGWRRAPSARSRSPASRASDAPDPLEILHPVRTDRVHGG